MNKDAYPSLLLEEEKEVAAAVETLRTAMINGRRDQLEAIAADELTYGHSSGNIEDKATFVETIASGRSNFVSIDFSEQSIQIFEGMAIVRNKLSAQTNDNGKPAALSLALLMVFRKQYGEWKLVARQAVKLAI